MEITTTMIVQDNEIKEFTCFTCQKRFPLISDLTRHLTTEHKPDEALSLFEKPKASKGESDKDGVICVPTQSTAGERRALCRSQFFCSVCNRGFALKHHVVRHEEKIHNIFRPKMRNANRADATPKTVVYVPNEVGGMTSHIQPLHQEPSISSTTDLTPVTLASSSRQPRPRPHICEVCAKGFTQRHHLKRHREQAHKPKETPEGGGASGESSSCLAVVPVTLSEANEVVQAKNDKPLHRCSSCYRGFTERHHMIRHEKTVHESKKDHHCILCGKLFSQKHHLLNHQIAIHCKTRNYACSVCSKKFSLKHQLQRHEKRVHNTQILADGTVIKKRRQKKEIGPDGKPRLTWTGGEVIGFAGPPNGGTIASSSSTAVPIAALEVPTIRHNTVGGDNSGNKDYIGDGIDDDAASSTAKTASTTATATTTEQLLRDTGVQVEIGMGGGGGVEIRCAARGEDKSVMVEKVEESDEPMPANDGVPVLPVVEGEERCKVEALILKLSNAKQMQAMDTSPSATDLSYQASSPALISLNAGRSVQSTEHFPALTPPPRQASSSAPASPALNHSPKGDVIPLSSSRSVHPSSPYKSAASTSNVNPQYVVNGTSASSPVADPSTGPLSQAASRTNSSNHKPQFLPPSIFAPPGTTGFQASPFFHMASNVISGLPPMEGVTEANRKWAFLGDPSASSNTDGIPPPTQCNFQTPNPNVVREQTLNSTTTQNAFLGSQSALYTNAAYPISMSMTQHQPQHSVLQFPPL